MNTPDKPRIRYDISNGVWLCGGSYGDSVTDAYGQWFMTKRIREVSIEANNKLLQEFSKYGNTK